MTSGTDGVRNSKAKEIQRYARWARANVSMLAFRDPLYVDRIVRQAIDETSGLRQKLNLAGAIGSVLLALGLQRAVKQSPLTPLDGAVVAVGIPAMLALLLWYYSTTVVRRRIVAIADGR